MVDLPSVGEAVLKRVKTECFSYGLALFTGKPDPLFPEFKP